MSLVAFLVGLALGVAAALAQRTLARRRRARRAVASTAGAPRVVLPFGAHGPSAAAVAAALRLTAAQGGVLVPTALVVVPRRLPPDAPLPRQSEQAMGALEAVELEAAHAGVPVEGRIERGRSLRHALVEALVHEPAERVVLAAEGGGVPGLAAEDVAWLLGRLAPEVVVLRPALDPDVLTTRAAA